MPLTQALAVMRYGVLGAHGPGLHDIWGAGSSTAEAFASLAVVGLFAIALISIAVRVFSRSALR